ncbi:aspartyl protease family protein [Pseudooceanicola antarcticus]|uniref:Aspartyl protease family protein n=2 Tax=Pseudooceanicola antarcticus TaxID=1247613 RepID=A0A285IZ73_9RHOB|nr:TIGR02281 family clan AA aspartic protease [Pseudooceanicola antarcticus]PJE25687.1 TIGR02281 family clan AA aspartic protease [Pseudooceanicola antarcticus]SNY53258.1 aspartyl protease family protein [Pseudooceanicola antarcticus]
MLCMSGYDVGNLAYLGILLAAIGGYYFVSHRDKTGQLLRHALLWALIFVAVIAGVGLWDQVRSTLAPAQRVEGQVITLPQQADGHFYAVLEVNGAPMRFLVDTGATDIVLTRDAARAAGLPMESLIFSGRAGTANGTVRVAPVRLREVTLGPVTDRDVRAMVNDGELDMPLLGMSYLSRFSHIEITGQALRLTR